MNSKTINDKPTKKSNFIVYSDASASGCGAYLDLNGEQACHKLWEVSEGEKGYTWRELSAVRIIQVGSMKRGLLDLAIKIFQCYAKN